jgi:hypothetical protein
MKIRIAPAGAIRMLVCAELTAVAARRLCHIGDADELTPRCAILSDDIASRDGASR